MKRNKLKEFINRLNSKVRGELKFKNSVPCENDIVFNGIPLVEYSENMVESGELTKEEILDDIKMGINYLVNDLKELKEGLEDED